jgi:RES domain-containing protein
MRLWRLSGIQHAGALGGGYGLFFDGRWNTIGHAVTYCAHLLRDVAIVMRAGKAGPCRGSGPAASDPPLT